MKSKNYFLTGLFVCLCVAFASGQELRGYQVGRYEGNAANAKGKIVVQIKSIDSATGAVNAHFTASEGLAGEGDLTGKIDQAGVLRLSGAFGNWKMTVAAKVKADEIKANYRLTGQSAQTGTFTAMLMQETAASADEDELAPPDEDDGKTQTSSTPTANAPPMPGAPSVSKPTTVNQTEIESGVKSDSDNQFPTPDFSAMEKWYEIKKWEYDIYATPPQLRLLIVVKTESRPRNFGLRFEDEDGVIVSEPQLCGFALGPGVELNVPIRCSVWIPDEKKMKRVKTVRAVKRD